ncbi:MAG: spore germination protein GerW family protein [Gemmatimonadales bacterium]
MTFGYAADSTFEDKTDPATLVESIGRRVGSEANAETVFGEPVTRDGVTVIPVAKVRWALAGGGGTGSDDTADGEDYGQGAGAAAAVTAKPLGHIEMGAGGTEFRPVRDRAAVWPLIAASGVAVWLALRALRGLRR